MTYHSPYKEFCFDSYEYDLRTCTLSFRYSFDEKIYFTEKTTFESHGTYDSEVFDSALRMAFLIAGISYYKLYPTKNISIKGFTLDEAQSDFFSTVYRDGLSQFVYENDLSPGDIGKFESVKNTSDEPNNYDGDGMSVLQSGGKDSLLLANLLIENNIQFHALYMQQGNSYPIVIGSLGVPLRTYRRTIDRAALATENQNGGLNGHVPVTYITLAYALVDTILTNGNTVLSAIGKEGDEPHAYVGDFPVTHQWSKTWEAEKLLVNYVTRYIAPQIKIGSPLRGYSELKIAELFVTHCWQEYSNDFSSCNVANYRQGQENAELKWCGECPKCANSYLLFSAFVPVNELIELFGQDLYTNAKLEETFKGLLGIGDTMKPFECVGEIDELRLAYQLSQKNGYTSVSFDVPTSNFNKDTLFASQPWASQMIQ